MRKEVVWTHGRHPRRAMRLPRLRHWGACCVSVALLGCASAPWRQPASPAPAVESVSGVASAPVAVTAASPAVAPSEPVARSATVGEQALSQGVKAYQAGQYAQAEAQLKQALKVGLPQPADAAQAHKHLAFIYCTSRRESLCAAAFKAARAADPKFALSKAEAGHPMWSQVYRKALGLK